MRFVFLTLFLFLSIESFSQKFPPFVKTYRFNNVSIQRVSEGYEEIKDIDCVISIDSTKGTVSVEMGNERPRHYIIATRGTNRKLELGNDKVYSFRLSPVIGKGDYMFIKPDWQFVVLMVEEEQDIYIFKNVSNGE